MSHPLLARRALHAATPAATFAHLSIVSLGLVTAAVLAVPHATAHAQELAVADAGTGAVAGVVTNSAGDAVRGVRVRVAGQDNWVQTDRTGSYHIDRVPAGQRVVQFVFTDDVALAIAADVTRDAITGVEAVLPAVPRGAPLIVPVTGPVVVRYGPSAALAGFLERARHGGGYYFTRAELLGRGHARVSEILRSIPGLAVTDGAVTMREPTMRMTAPSCDGVALYLDGAPLVNESGVLSLLDSRPLGDFAGIEAYTHPGGMVPVQAQSRRSCATVLIWTLQA